MTSTDPTTLGDVLERLERYAPPSRMACIRGPRNAPGELWIEMFDGQVMIAGQAAGTPPDKPITLPRSASTQMAKMLTGATITYPENASSSDRNARERRWP